MERHADAVDARRYDIEYTPVGDQGPAAKREVAGLMLYFVSMAAFLFWLLRYGVNV